MLGSPKFLPAGGSHLECLWYVSIFCYMCKFSLIYWDNTIISGLLTVTTHPNSQLTISNVKKIKRNIQCIATMLPAQWVTILIHVQIITMQTIGWVGAMHKNFTYYAWCFSLYLLCSKLFRHNWCRPIVGGLQKMQTISILASISVLNML